jgi:mycofactocin precursor
MQNHAVQVNSVEAVEAITDEPTSELNQPLLLEELLVEEISIDGMCGVY